MAERDKIHRDMPSDMNQRGLASETSQPLHSSQKPQMEDEVTKDIKKMIQDCGNGLLLPECCIYRVPITLRHLKEEAYTPQVVSIGPYHHGNERLRDMENHKKIFFKRFTQKSMSSLDDLVRFVKHLEPKVRASYSETIHLTKQELVKLTLMDAGFIIVLFIMCHERHEVPKDAKLSQLWLTASIHHDLLLLENQLPFFVIEELFNKAFPLTDRSSLPSFLRLTYNYFGHYNRKKLEPNRRVKINHFTDLLRLFYMQGKIAKQHSFFEFGSHRILYNVNVLKEAGVKLKASKSECLLDLKFSGNILEIPQIVVDDNTELLFRNMIAFEQCHYPYAACISDYALVFDCLIDTHKDVDLLVHKEIVRNCLGDPDSVALLFNGLSENFIRSTFDFEYFDMNQRLNSYCRDSWHKMVAALRRDYCNTPWHTVASIAGIILLVLTIIQTIFSVLQVVLK